MSTTYYERCVYPSGAVRYMPVAERDTWDSLPIGTTWVIDVRESGRSMHRVPANLAEVVAALEPLRERLVEVVRRALDEKPSPSDTPEEQLAIRAALKAYRAAGGDRSTMVWQGTCATDVVRELFEATAREVK